MFFPITPLLWFFRTICNHKINSLHLFSIFLFYLLLSSLKYSHGLKKKKKRLGLYFQISISEEYYLATKRLNLFFFLKGLSQWLYSSYFTSCIGIKNNLHLSNYSSFYRYSENIFKRISGYIIDISLNKLKSYYFP